MYYQFDYMVLAQTGHRPDVLSALVESTQRDTSSNAQERLCLLHQLEPTSARYNLFTGIRLDGDLESPFGRRVDELTRHAG